MSSAPINAYPLDMQDRIAIVLENGQTARSGHMLRCIESLEGLAVNQHVFIVNASQHSPEGVAEALHPGIEDGETIVLIFAHKGKLGSKLLMSGVERRQEGIVPT